MIYLENTPLHEAIERWTDKLLKSGISKPLEGEFIKVADSLGRITAEAVFAKISSPFYHSSAMDGYAVRFADTFGASEKTPKQLKIPEQAVYISTGDPVPDGFDAVIMIEDINIIRRQETEVKKIRSSEDRNISTSQPLNFLTSQEYIEIIKPATPWQHVRTIGEDIITTELILPENHKIRSIDIGAMLAGGLTELRVRRKPKVVIIPTGSELVEPGGNVRRGNIIESNSRILAGLVTEWGGEPVRSPIVPDNIEELKKTVREATQTGDLIVINAGASAGKKDFTATVIRELGEIILHGLSIKPGKPAILGWINNKPVLGIPGYPVSAYITFELFAKLIIHIWQGIEIKEAETIRAKLSRHVASTLGMEEFLRVKVGKVGENIIATPVSRGAGILMSLVRADGFVRVPAMSEGLGAGTEVEVRLIRYKSDISNTIVCIGSHDNTLDILANFLKKKYPKFSLSSAHVGSMGGLIALKRGEAHIAGTHLLDEETGEYNIPFIKRLFNEDNPPTPPLTKGGKGGFEKIILINLVYRQQGLLVLKGNPKNIGGFEDLLREDITFVNRQSGSGTRLLTDKYLKELKIDHRKIKGYEKEEFTHMSVASAVLNGIADTGLGILAASKALGLDFIPVAKERYDLAVPERFYKLDMIQKLLGIIRNDMEFKNAVVNLRGYDVSDMGKVIYGG
jgi:putative molybdopterin biosynthesis protein